MIFSSKTPRDLNHDPEPYAVRGENNRWRETIQKGRFIIDNASVYAPRITATFDPRPEFDHVQHNKPNPILVALREEIAEDSGERYFWGAGCMVSIGKREVYESGIAYFIGQIENMRPYDPSLPRIAFGIEADAEHIDHARRVLTRLANLTKEN